MIFLPLTQSHGFSQLKCMIYPMKTLFQYIVVLIDKNRLKTKCFQKIADIGKRPSPRAAFGFTQNGSQAYLFGGRCAAGRQNDLYQEDFEVYLRSRVRIVDFSL